MYMKDAEIAESTDYRVTWKTVTSGRIDSKKLKTEYPDIYDKCLSIQNYRRFTIKQI